MSTRDNGGAAFPVHGGGFSLALDGPPMNGMTLRDYFAAKALTALASNPKVTEVLDKAKGTLTADAAYASMSYVLADAMLAERAK